MEIFSVLKFIAIIGIPLGKWFQVLHIYRHKEVRDLSTIDILFSLFSYIVLAIEADLISSDAFYYKNVAALLPVCVLLAFKVIYRNKEWHDSSDKHCLKCNNELEPNWLFCPDCGAEK